MLLPIVTFGITYAKDDTDGENQWVRDLGVNEVLNTGLRVAFNGTSWPVSKNRGRDAHC